MGVCSSGGKYAHVLAAEQVQDAFLEELAGESLGWTWPRQPRLVTGMPGVCQKHAKARRATVHLVPIAA